MMKFDIEHAALTPPLLNTLGALTHELQIERGYTALVVDSAGEIFSDELRAHYLVTDQTLNTLDALIDNIVNKQSKAWAKKLDAVRESKAQLLKHRKNVQNGDIEFAAAINTYTYKFIYPVIDLNIEIALNTENVNPLKVSAYSNFLQWKERIGRERAWGAHGFCSKVFKNREFTERMLTLIEEQSAYRRAFMSLATKRQQHEVEESLGGYVMELLDTIHAQLGDQERAQELEALSPVTWFELLTGKIDRMRRAETGLVKSLDPQNVLATTTNDGRQVPQQLERH
ncbi:MAG: nitrate- and nitrite sensing domain-containing protein, partial [Robiginitomaculum sp.]|nr:nitrate- and nitrite sensing domain-containing protein [Robiginitomaculum sp.]